MAVYQSYPPNILMLSGRHDLKLVGTVVGTTLEVDYTWDSAGRSATIDFGDGTTESNSDGAASHTYAEHEVYTVTVRSGQASDSADIDLSVADEPEDEPEPTESTPEPERASESYTDPTEEA